MREIKFRHWNNEDKVMNYDLSSWLIYWIQSGDGVMQFTGLKDKNGKEIYDGDIVSGYIDSQHGRWNMKGKVFYDHAGFRLKVIEGDGNREGRVNYFDFIGCDGAIFDHMEVIGNIYENPELLPDAKVETT